MVNLIMLFFYESLFFYYIKLVWFISLLNGSGYEMIWIRKRKSNLILMMMVWWWYGNRIYNELSLINRRF